jgi:hypothetical protein
MTPFKRLQLRQACGLLRECFPNDGATTGQAEAINLVCDGAEALLRELALRETECSQLNAIVTTYRLRAAPPLLESSDGRR